MLSESETDNDLEKARNGSGEDLNVLIFSTREEVLEALINNPNFGQREALILLNRKDLSTNVLKLIADQRILAAQHSIQLALLRNPKTPPNLGLPLVKFLFPFELMAICLLPAISVEVRQAAEGLLISQLPKLPVGQKINLARRGPASVVKHLLVGDNPSIFQAALNNPYMSEEVLMQVLLKPHCTTGIVTAIAMHPKWSIRYPLRIALARHPLITLSLALRFLLELRPSDIRELTNDPRVNPEVRRYVQNKLKAEKLPRKI